MKSQHSCLPFGPMPYYGNYTIRYVILFNISEKINDTSVICASPRHMTGLNLRLLHRSQLACPFLGPTQISVICLLLVLLSLTVSTTAFLVYRHRQRHGQSSDKQQQKNCCPYDWSHAHEGWAYAEPISSSWPTNSIHPTTGQEWPYNDQHVQQVHKLTDSAHWAVNSGMAVYCIMETPDYQYKF